MIPRGFGGERGDVVVGDLRHHARHVAGFLLLPQARRGAFEAGLVPDERVVRRAAVEAHAGADELAFVVPFLVGVADDRHGRDDRVDVGRGAARLLGAGSHVGQHVAGDVARLAEWVDVHAVGDLTGHAQHPRVHRGDVDLGIGRIDGAGAPLGRDEVHVVEIAVMVELAGPESREACLHGAHVVAQSRARLFEGHAVAAHHVRPDLGAETEPEPAAGGFLQFPRRRRRDEGTARKRDGDTGGQLEAGSGLGCDRRAQICGPAGLGQEQTGESGCLRALGECAHLDQRLRNCHHVDVHSGQPTAAALADGEIRSTTGKVAVGGTCRGQGVHSNV